MKVNGKILLQLLLLFALYLLLLPQENKELDFQFWSNWAVYIHQHGITNVYSNPNVDYPPVLLYLIGLYDSIQGNEFNIVMNLNYLKVVPMFFDFLPIVVVCGFKHKYFKDAPWLFLIASIAYLYNSMIWGQMDSIYTALCFLAILAAFERPVLSVVLFAISLGAKLHSIIFLPPLALLWFYSIKNGKQLLGAVLAFIGTLFVIVLPFVLAGKFHQLWHVITHVVGRYPYVSISGFNIWYLIYTGNPNHTIDTETYFILSYKHIGLLLFFTYSGLVLLPMLFRMVRLKKLKLQIEEETIKMLLLGCGLLAIGYYYFNTEMHERYAHAAMLFFFFYGVLSKKYLPYILISIAYFLGIEKSFPDFLPIEHYKIIFASKVIAIWYTVTLAYGSYLYFSSYGIRKEWKEVKNVLARL